MKKYIIGVQIANAAIFAFLLYGGPPMGESELHPWDVLALVSSLVVVVLCPLAYICIWKKKRWPRFTHVMTSSILSISSLFTLAQVILYIQWPDSVYDYLWNVCVFILGKKG